ncbi:hypothetical protein ACVOMT_15450 [Sphingomonas panni]
MAPHIPSRGERTFAGQVVRPPSPAEGVGQALRRVFDRDAALPRDWDHYLRSLDDLPKQ